MNTLLRRTGRTLHVSILLLCALLCIHAPNAFADPPVNPNTSDVTDDEAGSINAKTPYFSQAQWQCANNGGNAATTTGTTVTGSDAEKSAYDFLVGQKGLTPQQAVGIIGNLMWESHMDPKAQEDNRPGHPDTDPFPKPGIGFGIAQWTPAGRQQALTTTAKNEKKPVTDLGVQFDYLWQEFTTSYASTLGALKAVNSSAPDAVTQATTIVMNGYESPLAALAHLSDRIKLANDALALYGKSTPATTTAASGGSSAPSTTSTAAALPANATDDQKIAQTFMVGFTPAQASTAQQMVQKYHLGGVFVLGGDNGSVLNKQFFAGLNQAAGTPLLVASDEEGGKIQRFAQAPGVGAIPSAKQMGQMSDTQVEQTGKSLAQGLLGLGVNMDLAPVLDVDNGTNPVISLLSRSFSADPAVITDKAGAFAKGLQEGGVAPTFKHFPGFGQASGNSDAQPVTTPDLSELESKDLVPYATLANQYDAAVMLDNANVPGLDASQPASVSTAAVNLLRGKYGFTGLITTDDLHAGALTGQGVSLPQAVTRALQAGVDMPLFTFTSDQDLQAAINSVKAANIMPQIQAADNQVLAFKAGPAGQGTTSTAAGGCSASSGSGGGASGSVNCTNLSESASGLSAVRQNVVCIAEQELNKWKTKQLKPGSGYMAYSQNNAQDWCADFASWVYDQAKYPLQPDPNWRVSWVDNIRIIGVKGSNFHWHPVGSYTPKPGDLAIHGLQHVNLVDSVNGNSMHLIGGNQGSLNFNTSSVTDYTQAGFSGEGTTGYVSPD